jgi:glycosyltransferase involved in cell wall biosynthesis
MDYRDTGQANLNLLAPMNSLGYGIAGQNVLKSLHAKGIDVSLFPIPANMPVSQMDISDDMKTLVSEVIANAGNYDPMAPSLRIWHQHDLAEHVGRGIQVGFPFFELDRFNARERHHLSLLDRVFVTSEWAKSIVDDQVGGDVKIVPLGVDRNVFNEDIPTTRLEPDYTVFVNAGKWEKRKGHDVLLSAFNRAFSPTDKVMLKLLCHNPFIGQVNDYWAREYLGSPLGRAGLIKLEPRLTSHEAVAILLKSADCGVFPSRAEGWNLELLESLSVGLNVIATHTTAHTEYLNEGNARLIHCDSKELAEDGIWFHGQGQWSALEADQEEQLIAHMREIHRLKQTGGLRRNEAGIETAKVFSWENTATCILKGLQ